MSSALLYMGTGLVLFFLGIHGMVFYRPLLRKTLALNITGTGIFLFLVAHAYQRPDGPPDPVPHGLILTGIVIAASATALMLFLIVQVHAVAGSAELPDANTDDPERPS